MSEQKLTAGHVADYYDGLYTLGGAVLDKESYLKHKSSFDEAANAPDAADPFAQPQDLRQLAAQAFEADAAPDHDAGRPEYRPEETAPAPTVTGDADEETGQVVLVLEEPTLIFTGSGSYFGSGSYRFGSGSYRYGSGSYAPGSSGADDLMDFGGYGLGLI